MESKHTTLVLLFLCLLVSLRNTTEASNLEDDGWNCRYVGPCVDKEECRAKCAAQPYVPYGAECLPGPPAPPGESRCCCMVTDTPPAAHP